MQKKERKYHFVNVRFSTQDYEYYKNAIKSVSKFVSLSQFLKMSLEERFGKAEDGKAQDGSDLFSYEERD